MNGNYDDIINLPHYEPKHHKRMAPEVRAAQFAPFAALTGYDDAIAQATVDNAETDAPLSCDFVDEL
ncbi:MAG: hypothetical protein ACI30V_00715 [Muribaculaceae bacterium]